MGRRKKPSHYDGRAQSPHFTSNPFATRSVLRPTNLNILSPYEDTYELSSGTEDFRRYNPSRLFIGPGTFRRRSSSRLVVKSLHRNPFGVSPVLRFQEPRDVLACARRGIRRNVIHALKLAGKRGVGKGKKRRQNAFSQYSCRK